MSLAPYGGHGLGSALLAATEAVCRARGAELLEINVDPYPYTEDGSRRRDGAGDRCAEWGARVRCVRSVASGSAGARGARLPRQVPGGLTRDLTKPTYPSGWTVYDLQIAGPYRAARRVERRGGLDLLDKANLQPQPPRRSRVHSLTHRRLRVFPRRRWTRCGWPTTWRHHAARCWSHGRFKIVKAGRPGCDPSAIVIVCGVCVGGAMKLR